jgi:hypothetical protein
MLSQEVRLRSSSLELGDIAHIFEMTLQGRGVQFKSIEDDPFASARRQPELKVVACRDKKIGSWAVQLYVFDEGDFRILKLVALHDSAFERIRFGTQYTISKRASMGKVMEVAAALQEADPSIMVAVES